MSTGADGLDGLTSRTTGSGTPDEPRRVLGVMGARTTVWGVFGGGVFRGARKFLRRPVWVWGLESPLLLICSLLISRSHCMRGSIGIARR